MYNNNDILFTIVVRSLRVSLKTIHLYYTLYSTTAFVFGDPHLVTLDHIKYTFNGKGEFTLIEAVDGSFTVQGRMVEATGNDSNAVSATVFSAIAAKQSTSDTVQFQLSTFKGIITLINGEEVDFSGLKTQQFNNVSVSDLGDRVQTASFANGAFMRIKEENGIISVLIVGLPRAFKGKTRGLMGNFNGDQSDDLKPRNGPIIPLLSSLKEIHNKFGLTCELSFKLLLTNYCISNIMSG